MNELIEFMQKWMGLSVLGSKQGSEVDKLLVYFHLLMVALFVGWSIFFLYALWRFRKSRNPTANYDGAKTHTSTYLEVGVAVIEFLLLFGLAVPYWVRATEKFPPEEESTVIRVIARQFNWTARYAGPDGMFGRADASLMTPANPFGLAALDPASRDREPNGWDDILSPINEIVVPVDKPVIAYLSSLDVIHSFKIVPLRVTQDAIPGMSIPVHFTPTRLGTYEIQCSQLCGSGHFSMRGFFRVVTPSEYETWLKAHTAPAPAKTV
jgi:cytochrome c oxidase subunit II